MFGRDDDKPQAPSSDFFSTDNFVPPAAATPSDTPAPQDLSTPELPATSTPDPAPAAAAPPTSVASNDAPDDGLLNLKQQALQQLSPLVDQLEQTSEEKFRTTMMMIQASDDQSLLKTAFEAAQAIADDKARAQALLDVINEINYFTQHKS